MAFIDDANYVTDENGGKLRRESILEWRGTIVDGARVGECTSNSGILVNKIEETDLCISYMG